MPKLRRMLRYWAPLLVWMAVIFSASADANSAQHSSRFFLPFMHWLFPRLSAERLDAFHYLFRKCGHLTEYAILGWLFWRVIRRPVWRQRRPWRWDEAGLALACVLVYAASDELHQTFVPTRTGQVSDVFIDTGGAALGLLGLWLLGKIFKRW